MTSLGTTSERLHGVMPDHVIMVCASMASGHAFFRSARWSSRVHTADAQYCLAATTRLHTFLEHSVGAQHFTVSKTLLNFSSVLFKHGNDEPAYRSPSFGAELRVLGLDLASVPCAQVLLLGSFWGLSFVALCCPGIREPSRTPSPEPWI